MTAMPEILYPAQVSILVLVDVSLETRVTSLPENWKSVSILVLVDVSLESGPVRYTRARTTMFQSLFSWMFRSKSPNDATPARTPGFNPCSRGCFARNIGLVDEDLGSVEFQSLFSWMFRSKKLNERLFAFFLRFQSLFSWMFRSKSGTSSLKPHGSGVSILVLVDVSLEKETDNPELYYWRGFNPCSRGCFARNQKPRRIYL